MTASFDSAGAILAEGVERRAFPGAVAEVGTSAGVQWQMSVGRHTYDPSSPPANAETVYDLASLTKVIATAPVLMQLVDRRALDLDDSVSRWLDSWTGQDRAQVTVRDLLAHTAGLTAHLPFYRDHDGRPEFERAICTLPLEYTPRTRSVYSDLGFMLLAFIAENAGGRAFDELFADVRDAVGAGALLFRPGPALRLRVAPTEVDLWRGRLVVGEVHDQNAWALGGVAGHAGLFGTAGAVGRYARVVLAAVRAAHGADVRNERTRPGDRVARPEIWREFTTRTAIPDSSRALGWDTMLATSSCGTRMRATAIGHTGFTGTSVWIDWEAGMYAVLLTNRVHPSSENNRIVDIRRAFHDAVMLDLLRGEHGTLRA